MKYLKQIVLLLSVLAFFSGCIKDDLSNCNNVFLHCLYLADGNTDVFYKYVDYVDLYVFNEQQVLIKQERYSRSALDESQTIPGFRLSPGSYHVVILGNASGERTAVRNLDSRDYEKITFSHPDWIGGGMVRGQDANYLGTTDIKVEESLTTDKMVQLYSSHIDVSVEIEGLPLLSSNSSNEGYDIYFENAPMETNFENRVSSNMATCHPVFAYNKKSNAYKTLDLHLFRFKDDTGLSLKIENSSGVSVFTKAIIEFLRENPKVDITKQEAVLPILVKFTSIGVEVKVPDWYLVDINPGWQ